jgi:hypothetical protein
VFECLLQQCVGGKDPRSALEHEGGQKVGAD